MIHSQIDSIEKAFKDIESLIQYISQNNSKSIIINSDYMDTIQIGGDEVITLANALLHSHLTKVNLASNEIGDAGAIAIANALPTSKVTEVTLFWNKIGDAGAIAIANALPTSHVTKVNLSSNEIRTAGVIALANALPTSKVTEFDIGQNVVDLQEILALANALPASQVTNLFLYGTSMTDDVAINLIEALYYSKVTTLGLSNNEINDDFARALAIVLPYSKITEIDLSHCDIGDTGAIAIANALPHSHVTRIELEDNFIGNVGMMALVELLTDSNVTFVSLEDNEHITTNIDALEMVLRANRARIINDFDYERIANKIDPKDLFQIATHLYDLKRDLADNDIVHKSLNKHLCKPENQELLDKEVLKFAMHKHTKLVDIYYMFAQAAKCSASKNLSSAEEYGHAAHELSTKLKAYTKSHPKLATSAIEHYVQLRQFKVAEQMIQENKADVDFKAILHDIILIPIKVPTSLIDLVLSNIGNTALTTEPEYLMIDKFHGYNAGIVEAIKKIFSETELNDDYKGKIMSHIESENSFITSLVISYLIGNIDSLDSFSNARIPNGLGGNISLAMDTEEESSSKEYSTGDKRGFDDEEEPYLDQEFPQYKKATLLHENTISELGIVDTIYYGADL